MHTLQVLALDDPFIPDDSARPCEGAVPVRFFGTYEFAWIEALSGLAHFTEFFLERCQKSKDQQFQVTKLFPVLQTLIFHFIPCRFLCRQAAGIDANSQTVTLSGQAHLEETWGSSSLTYRRTITEIAAFQMLSG